MKSYPAGEYSKEPMSEFSGVPGKMPAPDTCVRDNESLYDALTRKGLTRRPNASIGGHLVKAGEIGWIEDNGNVFFALPGRHRLWSFWASWEGVCKITAKNISFQNFQIVTIQQGTMGLSESMGKFRLLEPGQRILQAPEQFMEAKPMNEPYVKLGTHHWVTIPLGSVGLAFDNGKKVIITPQELKIDEEHRQYIRDTNGGCYHIESSNFIFDPATGIKSVQMENVELASFVVPLSELVGLRITPSVRYQIVDPVKAFLLTEDVTNNIAEQAYATLTSVFSRISIDEIGATLASTATDKLHLKGKDEAEGEGKSKDLYHHATALFMDEFNKVVANWGVLTDLVNINSMTLEDPEFREAVKARAQRKIETATGLTVVEAKNATKMAEAEQAKKQAILEAQAEAARIRELADARAYAAKKDAEAAETLSAQPLAMELALMKGRREIAAALGDKTVITDSRMELGSYGIKGVSGQMLWMQNVKTPELMAQTPQLRLAASDDQ